MNCQIFKLSPSYPQRLADWEKKQKTKNQKNLKQSLRVYDKETQE